MPSASAIASTSRRTSAVSALPHRLLAGLAATLVVAVAAHIAFPLPFTPVPFTLQPLAVLGVGLFLGPLDGTLAMLAYLAEGAAGLPVFSPIAGLGGLAQLIGPTGGFLLAYPFVAFVCGWGSRLLKAHTGPFLAAAIACTLATVLLFLSGAGWLAHLGHLTPAAVWTAAIAPFLPGEAIKILAAAGTFRAFHANRQP